MSISVIFPLIVVLLLLSAFFSGSEIAFMSVNPRRLEKAGEKSVQDLTDRYIKLVDDITSKKEKEIMQI